MKTPIAILCSDIHLSSFAPVARAKEDWFEAMKRPFQQLKRVSKKYNIPIICAGDIFDKWNSTPELINWAIENMPTMHCIFGQHDLPTHNVADIKRSAYWTLVKATRIYDLWPGFHTFKNFNLYAFPWGSEVKPRETQIQGRGGIVNLAVVHKYIWIQGKSFEGAKDDCRVPHMVNQLKGYDAAVFGDNHKGFNIRKEGISIFNHGCMMRRKIDEAEYTPHYGILFDNGKIKAKPYDLSKDIIEKDQLKDFVEAADEQTIEDFMFELDALGKTELDFEEALKQYCAKYSIGEGAMQLIKQALSKSKK